jgi:hypothetical protein
MSSKLNQKSAFFEADQLATDAPGHTDSKTHLWATEFQSGALHHAHNTGKWEGHGLREKNVSYSLFIVYLQWV